MLQIAKICMRKHWNKLLLFVLLIAGGVFVYLASLHQVAEPQFALDSRFDGCRTEVGTTFMPDGIVSKNVTLATDIADTSQAFLLVQSSGPSGVAQNRRHLVTGYIANATTLTFDRGQDRNQVEISYAVVECFNDEFSVQRGSIAIADTATSNTAAITAVDTSRSMVLVNVRSDASNNNQINALVTGELASSTSVLAERGGSSDNLTVRYEVVEFSAASGVTVQTNEVSFGAGDSTTDTISSVDTSRSWMYCSWDTADNHERAAAVGCELTDSTTASFYRYQSTSYTNRIRYYVVEFPEDTVTVQRGNEELVDDGCTNGTQCNHDLSITAVASTTSAFPYVTNTERATGTAYPRQRWIYSWLDASTIRTSNWRSNSANGDNNTKYWQVVEFPAETLADQAAYRWFRNDDSTDVGTPFGTQDTPATLGSNDPLRLRILLDASDAALVAGDFDFKLQFAVRSGTCDTSFTGETYADVTALTDIAYYNNATPSDGDSATSNANDPTFGGDSIVRQTYEEANDFTNTSDVDPGEVGLWDFALVDNGAPFNTTYCFRATLSDGTPLDSYSVIPELTTFSGNFAPTGSFNSASEKTDGSGAVDVSIEIDDSEDDDIKAKIEYDDDAACDGPWTKATLDETAGATADFNDSGGSPSVVNADANQIGTTATRRVITASGSNTVDVDWSSKSDIPGVSESRCLRLTANDDGVDQAIPATIVVAIDNEDPSFVSASVSPSSGTVTEGQVVTVTLDMGETGMTIGANGCTVNDRDMSGAISDQGDNTYQILYSAVQGDGSWDAGALPITCEFRDANNNTTTVSGWTDGNTLAGDISGAGGGGGADITCPNITDVSFRINGDAAVTGSPDVELNLSQKGATEMIVSDSVAFLDVEWQSVTSTVPFTLSGEEGKKTVYLQLRNDCRTGFLLFDEIEYLPGASGEEGEQVTDDNGQVTEDEEQVTSDEGQVAQEEDQYSSVGGFIIARSVVKDALASAMRFATNLASTEDVFSGGSVTFTSGALDGETRTILSYDGETRTIEVDPPFTQPPANGDAFTIVKSTVAIEVPTAPVVVTPTPTPETPIVLIPLEDEQVIRTLSTIDGTLDEIRLRARSNDLESLRGDLQAASGDIVSTISAASSISLSLTTLEQIAGIRDRDLTSFIDVQDKVADLRALSVLARRLIEQGGQTPVAESYMTFGSLKMKYLLANPLEEAQTFTVSAYLPEEVRPEHVFGREGFALSYAQDAETYYAYGEFAVDGNQLSTSSIEIHDIWMLPDADVRGLADEADNLAGLIEGTRYEPEALLLQGQVNSAVEEILATQAASYASPQEHILIYRTNRELFDDAKADLDRLQSLTLRAEFGAFGGPNTLTMWLIALVLLLIAMFSGAFALLWRRETRLISALVESNTKKSRKKGVEKLHKHSTADIIHRWPLKHWRIGMLLLSLVSAIAAAYFFGIELQQMGIEEALAILVNR